MGISFNFWMGDDLLEQVDQYRKTKDVSRPVALRELIGLGLEVYQKKKEEKKKKKT